MSSQELKVLTDAELLSVIGGTPDPDKPAGDPGESGNPDIFVDPRR